MKVGSSKGTGPYHIQAEINMIPLIDVALVLLIIFMVISPILVQSQLNVNLPKVASTTSKSDDLAIKIEIGSTGTLSLQGKIIPRAELKKALKREIPENSNTSLLIQADKDVPFSEVVHVMDLAKQLKVQKLGVSVVPESDR